MYLKTVFLCCIHLACSMSVDLKKLCVHKCVCMCFQLKDKCVIPVEEKAFPWYILTGNSINYVGVCYIVYMDGDWFEALYRCVCVWMSNINAHFHFHSANVYVSASFINAHVYCISGVCTLSFSVLYALRTLGQGKWWTKRIKGGERLFLSSLSLVLLGAIMVVMKAHLSPSQLNLIIHNGIAVALEWGWVCVLFRGRSCMCVYENGCLKCSQWCIDLLMYLLSTMSEIGSYLIQKGNVVLCLVSIVRTSCGAELDQWTWITFRGQVK